MYGLSVNMSLAATAQLRELAPLLDPLGSGRQVTAGAQDVDVAVLCVTGVPCAALWPYDPRVGPATNNECLPYASGLVAPRVPGDVTSGELSGGVPWPRAHFMWRHICRP